MQEGIELISSGFSMRLFSLFTHANFIVKFVMLGLFAASIWCWAVIIDKLITYSNARRCIKKFEKMFWSSHSLEELYQRKLVDCRISGAAAIFMAAMQEWKKSYEKGSCSLIGLQMRLDRAMDIALMREIEHMEAHLGFLATVASTAPFVGLFGTVIGIMTSFQSIVTSSNTNIAVVAPGITEALLATAIGLFVAIPAVIAYNKLTGDMNRIAARLERFSDEFSSILSRQIDERFATRQTKS